MCLAKVAAAVQLYLTNKIFLTGRLIYTSLYTDCGSFIFHLRLARIAITANHSDLNNANRFLFNIRCRLPLIGMRDSVMADLHSHRIAQW